VSVFASVCVNVCVHVHMCVWDLISPASPSLSPSPPSFCVSGQQLDNFTGCAAILRFPLADPDEEEQEREGGEEAEYSRGEDGRRSRSGSTFFGADDDVDYD